MLQQLTSSQLVELEAMWDIEGGWGESKQDYRFGQLCSIHANINRDSKSKPRPYEPQDFALRPKEEESSMSDVKERSKKVRAVLDRLARVKPSKKSKGKK